MLKIKSKYILIATVLLISIIWSLGLFKRQVTWANLTDMDDDREVYLMPSSYISKSDVNGYGIISRGPYLSLPAGKYRLQWIIQGDGENHLHLGSANGAAIEPNIFALSPEEERGSFNFTLKEPASGFEILISFDDGSFLNVDDLRLYSPFYTDNAFTITFLILICSFALLYYNRTKSLDFLLPLLLIGFAVMFSSALSFKDSVTIGHDTPFHWDRLYNLADGLRSGQFPVRSGGYTYNGFGAITSIFYPDLLLYPGAIMLLLGASGNYVFQTYLVFLNALAGLTMYFCAKSILKNKYSAIIASILYILAPYHFTTLYVRHALGEAAGMATMPIFLCGLWECIYGDNRNWPILSAGAFLVYSSHILTTVMCAFLALGICILNIRSIIKENRLISIIKASILTLFLCIWHLLPMISYMKEGLGASVLLLDISKRVLEPAVLFLWRFGDQTPLRTEVTMLGFPAEPGLLLWFGMLLIIYNLIQGKKSLSALRLLFFGCCCLVMTLTWFPWERISALTHNFTNYFQFAWRFMTPAILFLSIASASAYTSIADRFRQYAPLPILFASVLFIMPSVTSQSQINKLVRIGETIAPLSGFSEYTLPETDTGKGFSKDLIYDNTLQILDYKKQGTNIELQLTTSSNTTLTIPFFAFPGYKAFKNGDPIDIIRGENGQMSFQLPAGFEGKLSVHYEEPILWRFAELLSCFALLCIIKLLLPIKNKKQELSSSNLNY